MNADRWAERFALRFWSKVDKTETCWLWTGGAFSNGYGQVWFRDRPRGAHVVSYELSVGPVPEGLELDHLCRVRACVNPAHLEPVTQQENKRRVAEAITHCPQGHLYDEENTRRFGAAGGRVCLQCSRARVRSWHSANRDLLNQKRAARKAARKASAA